MLHLVVAARGPRFRMRDDPGPHHVHVDVEHAAREMSFPVHRRGVIAIFPECAVPIVAPVVLLSGTPGDQLHRVRDRVVAVIVDEQVDVVRGDDVVQDAQAVASTRLEEPVQPAPPID